MDARPALPAPDLYRAIVEQMPDAVVVDRDGTGRRLRERAESWTA